MPTPVFCRSLAGLLALCSLTFGLHASPLTLSQVPPITVKEPPPNVVLTIDDSRSLGTEGLQALRNALKSAFSESVVPEASIRLAWHSLNRCRNLPLGPTTDAACGTYNGMRLLTAAHRKVFLDWVDKELFYELTGPNSTASHLATQRVADYFKARGDYNPWRNDPADTGNKAELSCRKSFHVFMTDGAWNYTSLAPDPTDGNGIGMEGNADGTSKRLPDGEWYDTSSTAVASRLYRDPWGSSRLSTFADLAFHLWSTDLRPDLPDNVRFRQNVTQSETIGQQTLRPYWNPRNNPATWQHLVTYTVGFTASATQWIGDPVWSGDMYSGAGIDGLMSGKTTWGSPLCGASLNEPCAFDAAANRRSQELWHAALNGRGRYLPSQNATDLGEAFKSILKTIQSENLAGAVSIATSARRLRKDGLVYLASFRTEPWGGDLTSSDVSAKTIDVEAASNWSASALLETVNPASRVILSSNGSRGIEFLWANLTPAQKNALRLSGESDAQGQDRLNYLRGDRSKESSKPGGTLRSREQLLGTIVNSNLWVNGLSPVYPVEYPGHAAFRKWVREANNGSPRTPMVYLGANDGMVHGFHGTAGTERLAYVPLGAYPKLLAYTSPGYAHEYIVDGSPFTGDVDVSLSGVEAGVTPLWRTLLVSPLGAGGRGYAVLDVTSTDPNTLKQTSGVLLDRSFGSAETTAGFTGFEEVGHITAFPSTDIANPSRADQFVKLNNGRWAVLLGNGVNSLNERPVLLIQFLDGGRELTTLVVSPAMGTGNGLGAPRPIDVDGNGTTDVVYAGDLRGQMWKFDLTSADPLQWGVAGWNGGAVCNGAITPCEPLVAVTSPNRKAQPILVAPMWVAHPQGGLVLTFGTGQLLEDKDRRDTTTQTVYGIWDSSRYRRGASGVTAVHGPPIPAGRTRSSLVEQTYTGTVAQTADTFDRRTFSTSSRNPVAYSSTDASAPRGWFIDMANPGERLLTHPQLQQGNLVRFETQVPPPTPEEGYCASSAQSGQGYVQVLQGLTGQPSLQPPFISPDATLNLTNVSKVAFGNGDSVLLMSENEAVLLSGQLKGGAQDIGTQLRQQLILARLKAVVRTVDWRILP